MLSCVTAATAWGFGASVRVSMMCLLLGGLLSFAGFYSDLVSDRRMDRRSGKTYNPVADGKLAPGFTVVLILIASAAAVAVSVLTGRRVVLPSLAVLLIILALSTRIMEQPFLRSLSLGALQGCYALIGCLAAGKSGWQVWLIFLFLFFAMNGGRVLGDLRDLPHDDIVGARTIPRVYGLVFSVIFLFVNEILAYAAGIGLWFSGWFRPAYLVCMILIAVAGTCFNIIFCLKPSPRVADLANKLSLTFLGGLYILAMGLGRQ